MPSSSRPGAWHKGSNTFAGAWRRGLAQGLAPPSTNHQRRRPPPGLKPGDGQARTAMICDSDWGVA